MNTEILAHSIVTYLKTHDPNHISNMHIIKNEFEITIYFDFVDKPIEIIVYNPQFIKVKVDDEINICSCLPTTKTAIDNLQRLKLHYAR